MKTALEKITERNGTSMNQFLVIAAAEKIAAMETERFFEERKTRADRGCPRCLAFGHRG